MVWEGSILDANEGIRFHGRSIADCQKVLPRGTTGTEMLPEAMFWLLLTGQVPSTSQIRTFSRELAEKSTLPAFVEHMLDHFPKDLHPMTQFACAVSTLNHTSKFAKAYEKGINKADYWEPTFDDSISLLAKLPTIAAKIHQNSYKGGGSLPAAVDPDQDWSYNFAAMLGKGGKENENFQDLLRLYLALHGDHEGGNVSAHATHLVGSALSDPFLSYSAGLQGLAGPLHGYVFQSYPHKQLSYPLLAPTDFCFQPRRARSPPLDPLHAIPHRHLLHLLRRKILPLVHPQIRPRSPRLRPRRAPPPRPALRSPHELRLLSPRDSRRLFIPTRQRERRDSARGADGTWQDEESLPERRCELGRAVPSLWLPRHALLHRDVWGIARIGPVGAIDLGSSAGVAD